MLKFKATIQIIGVNPYVLVSAQQAAELKPHWKKPLPVLVKVNNQPYDWWHINMMPVGDGSFYLYLHGDVRQASSTKVGDEVDVQVKFDDNYRSGPLHPMPERIATALSQNPTAVLNWEALSPSRQKEILRYFENLKSDEAKQRNLIRLMQALGGEAVQFMGRKWQNGR